MSGAIEQAWERIKEVAQDAAVAARPLSAKQAEAAVRAILSSCRVDGYPDDAVVFYAEELLAMSEALRAQSKDLRAASERAVSRLAGDTGSH